MRARTLLLFFIAVSALILASLLTMDSGSRLYRLSRDARTVFLSPQIGSGVSTITSGGVFWGTETGEFLSLDSLGEQQRFVRNQSAEIIASGDPSLRWNIECTTLDKDSFTVFLSKEVQPERIAKANHPTAWVECEEFQSSCSLYMTPVQISAIKDLKGADSNLNELRYRQVSGNTAVFEFSSLNLSGVELKWQPSGSLQVMIRRGESLRRSVIIDSGHGGEDLGACRESRCEKDLNREVGVLVGSRLRERLGSNDEVVLTRADDRTISLEDRLGFHPESSNLFVSIHADSVDLTTPAKTDLSGIGCYYFTPWSERRAESICAGMQKRGWKVDRLMRRNLYLLQRMTSPTILIEIGNIRSEQDWKLLQNEAELKRLAGDLADEIAQSLSAK